MNHALDRLVATGHLKVQASSESELAGFLENAAQSLTDAQIPALSAANRFKLAYDAVHALALAALRAQGYRPVSGPGHRAIVFQVLVHTAEASATLTSSLSRYHTKRNRSEYDGVILATDAEAKDMVALAIELRTLVLSRLERHRPPPG